jgi:hypothetical protein
MGKFRKVSAIFFIALSQFECNSQEGARAGAQCTYVEVFGLGVYEWKSICVQVVSKAIARIIGGVLIVLPLFQCAQVGDGGATHETSR